MDPKVVGALIGLGGTIAALVIRDVVLRLYLFYQERRHQVSDQQVEQQRQRHDTVRQYADPLVQASRSLMYRLNEIVNEGPATYLLPNAPQSHYVVYKRISTLYRLGAVLGWIRAFRKERSYLDPSESYEAGPVGAAIVSCEQALADGQDVEMRRLMELMNLWHVASDTVPEETRRALATEIDNLRHKSRVDADASIASDLPDDEQATLCAACANVIRLRTKCEIPEKLVNTQIAKAIVFLAIREAYLYRDWQSAIGDAMLHSVSDAPRRFDVVGFGEFEDIYLKFQADPDNYLWLSRLERIFEGLDFSTVNSFDARQEQIRRLRDANKQLNEELTQKVAELASTEDG